MIRFLRFLSGGYIIFNVPLSAYVISCSGLVLLSSVVRASDLPELQFSLKPRLCVLTEDEKACYDELQVSWQGPKEMSLCLFQSGQNEPLKCWVDVKEGKHKFVLSASQNVTFQLREPNKKLIVSEAFEVIHDQKKFRRQRRNPWSFF